MPIGREAQSSAPCTTCSADQAHTIARRLNPLFYPVVRFPAKQPHVRFFGGATFLPNRTTTANTRYDRTADRKRQVIQAARSCGTEGYGAAAPNKWSWIKPAYIPRAAQPRNANGYAAAPKKIATRIMAPSRPARLIIINKDSITLARRIRCAHTCCRNVKMSP